MKLAPFLVSFAVAATMDCSMPASPSLAAAPDNTLGVAIMAAHVHDDGVLESGTGATSSAKLFTGSYKVEFERDVSNCFFSGTTAEGSANPHPSALPYGDGTGVSVVMVDAHANTLADASFYLLVYCPK